MKNAKKYILTTALALSFPFMAFGSTVEEELHQSLLNTLQSLVLQLQAQLKVEVASLTEEQEGQHSPQVGFANDGYPVYGPYGYKNASSSDSKIVKLKDAWVIKAGYRDNRSGLYNGVYNSDHHFVQTEGDLDACNGRTAVTPEYPEGTYYYVMTTTYPYTPPCLKNNSNTEFRLR